MTGEAEVAPAAAPKVPEPVGEREKEKSALKGRANYNRRMEKHPLVPDDAQCESHAGAAALVEAVLAEFPKEMPRRFWLSDSIFADNWGKSRDGCFEESWRDWTEIEDWQIAKASSCPRCFLEEDEYAYLAPRNMAWIIREASGVFVSDSIAGDSFLWWLLPLVESGGWERLFTLPQRRVICRFLVFIGRISEDYLWNPEVDPEDSTTCRQDRLRRLEALGEGMKG